MNINLLCSIGCVILLFNAQAGTTACTPPAIQVKVLIASKPRKTDAKFTFTSKNGLLVTTSQNPAQKYFFNKRMPVAIKKKALFINNKKNDSAIIRITPVDGTITFSGQRYAGTIYLFYNDNEVAVVNRLPLEQYLESVLYTEGWPGWPLETYKVLAITCRTYVIWQLRQARKKNKQYHIKATNHHQTYTGLHANETISQAVQETAGIFIAHNNEPILAMYDSRCGGITPAKTQGIVNFADAPYLARTYPCTYCQECKGFSWQRTIPYTKVIELLHDTLPKLTDITDIKTIHDRAGVAQEIRFFQKGRKKPFRVSRKIMYNLFPEIKSYAFTCKPGEDGGSMVIDGVGLGHHMGLCQWGAQTMVEQNWDYKQIINFYYPHTKLMKLCTRKKAPEQEELTPTPPAKPPVAEKLVAASKQAPKPKPKPAQPITKEKATPDQHPKDTAQPCDTPAV